MPLSIFDRWQEQFNAISSLLFLNAEIFECFLWIHPEVKMEIIAKATEPNP